MVALEAHDLMVVVRFNFSQDSLVYMVTIVHFHCSEACSIQAGVKIAIIA